MSEETVARTTQFVRLFTANSRRVYTYILTLIPNRADTEEVYQDVSAILWDKFDEFELGTNFGAWACRIATFKVMKFREKQRRRATPFSQVFLESVDAELFAMEETLDSEYLALDECLQKLPQNDRRLIESRYQQGNSPQALSERLNLPVRQVYKSLARIRRNLLVCVTRALAQGGAG